MSAATVARAPAIVVAITAIALPPLVIQNRFWLDLLILVGIYAVFAVGLTLVFGYARMISFGHGGFFAVGAYCSAVLSLNANFNVFAAMAVVGFFLFIVFFVLTIPALIILFAGPLAPYVDDLQEAGSSQAAVMEVMTRFAQENPGALLMVTLFYAGVWLLLSSRLYLAASMAGYKTPSGGARPPLASPTAPRLRAGMSRS